MKRTRRYAAMPENTAGALAFDATRGALSVVIPLARTNLVTNPSLETNTTNYTAVGGSIARSTTQQYHGAYSLAITPSAGTNSDGVFYGTISLTSGTTYAYSCKVKGTAGRQYKLSVATTGGVDLTAYTFTATGRWQWVWGIWTETSSTTRRIYLRKNNHNDASIFYLDGLQVEACETGNYFPTTYIDGDQAGLLPTQFPPPFQWNGTPHASTSTRLVTTRAGGYVVNLDRFGFHVSAIAGLGLAALTAIVAGQAGAFDGDRYQTTVVNTRQFSLAGRFDAATPAHLLRQQSDLYTALGPDANTPRQPLVLHYEAYDRNRPISSVGRIVASYASGLEGTTTPQPREDATIVFRQWLPAILGGDDGAALTVQTSVSNANRILTRSADGVWSALGTGATGGTGVYAIAQGLDGKIYAGGDFTSMGGVANTPGIAYWDPTDSAWHAMSTGISGVSYIIYTIAIAPNGDVYAGGFFTDAGGSGADNIAKWNGSAWSVVGSATAINSTVQSIAFDAAGIMYVGGTFLNAGGDANADCLAQWNGSAWSAVGATSINSSVFAVAIGLDGSTLYIGGSFTNAGGVADADNIAKWNGSAWSALGTGTTLGVRTVAVDRHGFVYAGGSFTTMGGVAATYIARWNGSQWATLGSGVDLSVNTIVPLLDGTIAAGGDFITAGGTALPDRMAIWNGSSWVAFDVDQPGTGTVDSILQTASGTLFVGFRTTGTATAAGATTVTNDGTARAYPTITMNGPSSGTARIYRITNVTAGQLLYLSLTLNTGEIVTLRTAPGGAQLISNFRGDISSAILPGSSGDFTLAKGDNVISFFSASSSVTALMQWTISYQTAADLVE